MLPISIYSSWSTLKNKEFYLQFALLMEKCVIFLVKSASSYALASIDNTLSRRGEIISLHHIWVALGPWCTS